LGSTRQDLTVFSNYASLWAMGCESVLNIPARHEGQTLGMLNLLSVAHQYDGYDADAASILGRLAAPYLHAVLQTCRTPPADITKLETV